MSITTEAPDATAAGEERLGRLRATLLALALTALGLLASLLGGIAFLVPLFLLSLDVEGVPVFVLLTVVGQLGFLLVGYGFARWRGMAIPVSVPSVRETALALGGAVLALVVASALSALLAAFDLVPGSVLDEAVQVEPVLLLVVAVLSVVLIAPAEEFLFRGVVQGVLRRAYGPVGAVAGASLLFGSLHLANFTGAPGAVVAGALIIAGTGSVLGALYEYTGNLAVPIAAHAAYNVTLSAVAYATL